MSCNDLSFHPAAQLLFSICEVFVMHMCICKKHIRNLITHIHLQEIDSLQEKSSWGKFP